MASYSQASCTLATIRDVKAVYTYYLLASSTVDPGAAPKDGVNAPGASTIRIMYEGINYDWSLIEPTLDIEDNIIQTAVGQLYYIECAEFTDNSYDWGPMMTSSTYAAAKAAYNLSAQAKQATELLGGHFIYKSTSSGQSTPAGAGVIQTIDNNPANWGYNTWIGSNGIQLRRGETADATLSTNGLILSKGGIESGGLTSGDGYVYLSTLDKAGITINGHTPGTNDPKWRAIIGSKFGVDSEGNLYANGANIININGANIATNTITIGSFSENTQANVLNSNIHVPSTVEELTDSNNYTLKTDFDELDDYVTSHMVLNGNELSILSNSTAAKITLGLNGLSIHGNNDIIAQYGEGATIGAINSQHISIVNGQINFWDGTELNSTNLVAYVSNQELHIPRVVVIQCMQMGNWRWDASIEDHLSLNWIGG
jgi:hypothetical protein